jgi:hypothetical protein
LNQLVVLFLVFAVLVTLGRRCWRLYRRYRPRISLGTFMRGTVYIFLDHSLTIKGKTVIKIGRTQRKRAEVRMEEVMRDMGGNLTIAYTLKHVPFPSAVEYVAHQLMDAKRIRWKRGSTRGREWFSVDGEKGLAAAIARVERAARMVRRSALRRKRWPVTADKTIKALRYIEGRMVEYRIFR